MEFLKCFGAGTVSAYFITAVLFLLAYVFYRVLLTLLRRIFRRDGIWKELTEALRFPILAIFFEVAAVTSLEILGLEQRMEMVVEKGLLLVIIGTMGWLAVSLTRALYHHFMDKYERGGAVEGGERAMVAQVIFFYRLSLFIIFALTFASILMSFPQIKSIGIGILGSAGIAGIALGVAARPILLNLMAGFQIAMTKTIKIGDAVMVENDFSRIEAIHLTHVIARTWDLRRLILPISYFIDRPFQNWDAKDPELLAKVFIYCDYSAPVQTIRNKVEEIIKTTSLWNKKLWKMQVTNCTEQVMELRITMTANDATIATELQSFVREKVIDYLQREHPNALPCFRNRTVN